MKLALRPESGPQNELENSRQDAIGVCKNFAWLDQHHNGAWWAPASLEWDAMVPST